tara:strand:- start:29 stop:778 length:750 start_codon:yes stop_codon:yes gene_type:complete
MARLNGQFTECLRSGGTQGGGSVNKSFNFTAPNQPGIYYMQLVGDLQYSCSSSTGASTEFGDKTMGTVIVEGSSSPTATPTPAPTNTPTPTPSGSSWNGTHGTTVMAESDSYNIGTGSRMWWSIAGGKRGYFYYYNDGGHGHVDIARVNPSGHGCNGTMTNHSGSYNGFDNFSELGDVSTFQFSRGPNVGICSEDVSSSGGAQNDGLILFKQNSRYGVMRFVSISGNNMTIKWWLGNAGETDFRNAPNQ